jgi:hypothetical protein
MIASPSSPSVRFTALAEPTITIIAKGTKNQPMLSRTSLKTGKASRADNSSGWMLTAISAATAAMTKPSARRTRPDTPLLSRRLTLAQSSAKPIRPKATVTPSTIQT